MARLRELGCGHVRFSSKDSEVTASSVGGGGGVRATAARALGERVGFRVDAEKLGSSGVFRPGSLPSHARGIIDSA
jgi:hypothetical protein